MFDLLVVLGCWYFAFQNIKLLIQVPLGQWQLEQYLLLLVTIGLIAVGGMRALQYYQRTQREKADAAKAREEADKQQLEDGNDKEPDAEQEKKAGQEQEKQDEESSPAGPDEEK